MNDDAYRDERPAPDEPAEGNRLDRPGDWSAPPAQGEPLEPGVTQAPARRGARLPLSQPRATMGLLVVIGIIFVLENLPTAAFDPIQLGSQYNPYVALGEYWRLITAMFIHYGLAHVFFNAWALYTIGRDVEAFYGTPRFLIIYFLSGLFGNVVFYLSGSMSPSGGASGAIFGLVGAEIAFFIRNRQLFGSFSRQRLVNLAVLVAINLVFGFTVAGINNYAHLGGLISGILLSLALAPVYAWVWQGFEPRLVNSTPLSTQTIAVLLAVLVLLAGLYLGDQQWSRRLPGLLGGTPVNQTYSRGV